MSKITKFVAMALVSGALSGSTAFADPPASVVGTWDVVLEANETAVLVITNQGGPGAPGAIRCRTVLGTIGIAPVRGTYCPESGQFFLLHNNLSTGKTVRTFSGVAAEDVVSGDMQIAGTFQILISAFGDLGEYPFSATK
jgi:hypothetical protein